MSKELILKMSMSIDGFVGGPNGEMDWAFPSMSDAGRQRIVELLDQSSLLIMGTRSYQGWADFWPTAISPIARPMNEIPKAVFSRSGAISTPTMEKTTAALKDAKKADASADTSALQAAMDSWQYPIVAGKDLVADVERFKAGEGKAILAQGGASFAASLIEAKLVDVIYLVVHPVVLGRGLPIFAGLENPVHLKLEDLHRTDTGVVAKIYRPSY